MTNERKCSKCMESKTLDNFFRGSPGHCAKDGYEYYCKKCKTAASMKYWSKHPERKAANQKRWSAKWYAANKELSYTRNRKAMLKRLYGITPEQYESMFRAQVGVCGICFKPPIGERLCIDHNHATGKVRGLLCKSCNVAIGRFYDDTQKLKNAISYLEKHETLASIGAI